MTCKNCLHFNWCKKAFAENMENRCEGFEKCVDIFDKRTRKEVKKMRYSNFAIEHNKKWLFETAMKNSTPKRLAGHLCEAAEQIAQLQADLERSETKKDSAEVKE